MQQAQPLLVPPLRADMQPVVQPMALKQPVPMRLVLPRWAAQLMAPKQLAPMQLAVLPWAPPLRVDIPSAA
jgi:hypothetical protein